jgi:hypothetical protein
MHECIEVITASPAEVGDYKFFCGTTQLAITKSDGIAPNCYTAMAEMAISV